MVVVVVVAVVEVVVVVVVAIAVGSRHLGAGLPVKGVDDGFMSLFNAPF